MIIPDTHCFCLLLPLLPCQLCHLLRLIGATGEELKGAFGRGEDKETLAKLASEVLGMSLGEEYTDMTCGQSHQSWDQTV